MACWKLVVTNIDEDDNELGDWVRTARFFANMLEEAVEVCKDRYLLWPFGQVQENVGGDEATFIWREGKMMSSLRIITE